MNRRLTKKYIETLKQKMFELEAKLSEVQGCISVGWPEEEPTEEDDIEEVRLEEGEGINWTTADEPSKDSIYLKDLAELTSLKDIVITGQIKTIMDLKSYATKEGKKGLVYRLVLNDPTGDVTVVAFDDMADKLKTYTIGQYLRITNAWKMQENKYGKKELHIGNFAKIEVVE